HRIPVRRRGKRWLQCHFARSGAALVQRRQILSPTFCCHATLTAAELNLYELFRFGEGGGGHFWPNRGSGAKRGRFARRLIGGILCLAMRHGGGAQQGDRCGSQELPARFRHGSSEPTLEPRTLSAFPAERARSSR